MNYNDSTTLDFQNLKLGNKDVLKNCYRAVLLCFIFLCLSPFLNGQSLQWSQYASPNEGTTQKQFTVSIEKELNGSIYTYSTGHSIPAGGFPTFNTSNVTYYGNFIAGSNVANRTYAYLSKYAADGTTLEWVRVIAPESPTTTGTVATAAQDMKLSPTGEIVLLTYVIGGRIGNNLVTANAKLPNPPAFEGASNSRNNVTTFINKFSTNGSLLYGSYLSNPVSGSGYLRPGVNSIWSTQSLEIGQDGTMYIAFEYQLRDNQVGELPTTTGAFATSMTGSADKDGTYFMILKPDNTLAYATYLMTETNFVIPLQGKVGPNGDYYLALGKNGALGVTPDVADFINLPISTTAVTDPSKSIVLRFNSSGNLISSAYLPAAIYSESGAPTIQTLAIRPNGNVVVGTTAGDFIEYNESLTTVIRQINPFGFDASNNGRIGPDDMEFDQEGRLHFTSYTRPNTFPTTPGALSGSSEFMYAYYGIFDCNLDDIIYATEIQNGLESPSSETVRLYDLELEGCIAYLAGYSVGGIGFPVTSSAFSNDGSTSLSGYDITASGVGPTCSDGVLLAFNTPVFESNNNHITAPVITTFCIGSGVLPISGSAIKYKTPSVLGKAANNPIPTPIYYQWQVATNATGPWTDIVDSYSESFSPQTPSTSGEYFYRRLVRQTPFGEGFCESSCDVISESNVISLSFRTDNSHSTNIPEKKYALCPGSTSVSLNVNINQSVDGVFASYSYKLTTFTDLLSSVNGQAGTISSIGTPINLSVDVAGDYILQVTDSRGCTSFDTLIVENLKLDAGSATKFTCGAPSIQIGPISLPETYINYPTNSFSWSSATGLDNPNAVSPTFTHGLAVGDSVMKYLTFNGCLVDSIKIMNEAVLPLTSLPDLALCQGDTIRLGSSGQGSASLLTAQTGVTYEWAPGLGLVTNNEINPIVTTASAPAGVNTTAYTLLATAGNTGCVQTTTQNLTVYRQPNQSFNIIDCLRNGCSADSTLQYENVGTQSEPGISYSWTAIVEDDPNNIGNTGVPSNTEALSWLSSQTSSIVNINSGTPGMGYAAQHGYKITYIRTSFNTADPSCMRTDTTELYYCCGPNITCSLALGSLPTVTCGGVENIIGPESTRWAGKFYWSRLDGSPLNNELFDKYTGLAVVDGVAHPSQVVANPSGLVAIDYRLMYVLDAVSERGDTCIIDIKVFPGAVSKPNVNYSSSQAVCQGTEYTIQGPTEQPALEYVWSPSNAFLTPADTAKALPTLKGLGSDKEVFVTVTDPGTGCFIQDTLKLVVTPVEVNAGSDATFCNQGSIVDIGSSKEIIGYTYSWSAIPATGVLFGDNTKPITTATLPATTTNQTIRLVLTATNGLTPANCTLSDTVIWTAKTAPTVIIPVASTLCAGGEVTIGPITPSGASNTYTWAGPGILSGQGSPIIVVNAAGVYTVTVLQGACSANKSITINPVTEPVVDLTPPAPCANDATIGEISMTALQKTGWVFTWDKFDGMTANAADFSSITVRPTITTTYTLTAKHSSGCERTFSVVVPGAAYVAKLPTVLNFCEGQPAVLPLNDFSLAAGSVVWTTIPSSATSYLSSTTVNQPSINMASMTAGQYVFTATVTYGSGCISIAKTTVNIGKKRPNIAGFDQEICEGACVQLGLSLISGMSYQWSAIPTDGSLQAFRVAQPTVCPLVNTKYTLKYTDRAGCVNTDDVEVKIKASPVLSVTQNLTSCQNQSGTASVDLNSAIISNTGATTTFWQNAGTTVVAGNPISLNTTYFAKSVGTNGCFIVKPITVNINELPTGTVTPTFNCTTKDGSIAIRSSTPNARYAYSLGNSYSGTTTYSTASPIRDGFELISNLVTPPIGGQNYTVRIFGQVGDCFTDFTVNLVSTCCFINITSATPSACVPAANTYSLTVIVSYGNAPSGNIKVTTSNGENISVAQASSPQSITLTGLISDGIENIDVTAIFETDTTCRHTLNAAYDAPADCTVAPCPLPNCFNVTVTKN